jgi:hypothetical protein
MLIHGLRALSENILCSKNLHARSQICMDDFQTAKNIFRSERLKNIFGQPAKSARRKYFRSARIFSAS